MRQSFSSPNMVSELMDLQSLAREGPRTFTVSFSVDL